MTRYFLVEGLLLGPGEVLDYCLAEGLEHHLWGLDYYPMEELNYLPGKGWITNWEGPNYYLGRTGFLPE
jgi:hypothetical protein